MFGHYQGGDGHGGQGERIGPGGQEEAQAEEAHRVAGEQQGEEQRGVLAEPPPKGFVVAFGESGIDLELGFWIGDPEEGTAQIRSDINLEIWRVFKAAGIEIPFPQREVRMLGKG
jgi:small-conductance mechanosensitive channel